VRLADLRRTSSFRLALWFLLLFGTATVVLCGFLYWQTRSYLDRRVDAALNRGQATFDGLDPAELRGLLTAHVTMDPRLERPNSLFAPTGEPIAGSPLISPAFDAPEHPRDTPFSFTQRHDGRLIHFRGLIRRRPDGEYLLVAQDMTGIRAFRAMLLQSCLWGGLATVLVGFIGAAVAGADAVRRIDGVTGAIQRIVRGDLSGRLPTRGDTGDLDRLAQEVNFMLGEIERLMSEVKGVCDNVAHDLRTPLTRLLAGLERAHRRAGSAEQYAAAIDEAIQDVRGVLKTFAAMLRIAEVESGARRAGFTSADLSQITADVVEFYEPMAEAKGIMLSLECDAAVAMRGDPSLLFEAVGNLVDNALKFTPLGGRVNVRSFAGAGKVGVEVTDSGPGVPAEQREAVLRRFYRAEQSRHTLGSGLGLALVAGVAGLHGMTVEIGDANPGCRIALIAVPITDQIEIDFSPARSGS
jgi:signal transduction histidine kinase